MSPRYPFRGLTACLALAMPGLLPAAEAPASSGVVQLSPFQVSSEKDVGYLANNTLAGSRIRTNLADVANAISVFTPEFIADLNAFSENDLPPTSSTLAQVLPEQQLLARLAFHFQLLSKTTQ